MYMHTHYNVYILYLLVNYRNGKGEWLKQFVFSNPLWRFVGSVGKCLIEIRVGGSDQ